MITYKELEIFFKSLESSKKNFSINYTKDNKLFVYNLSQFKEWDNWYIQKADHKNIILSLKKYVLTKNNAKFIFHITIYPSTWNSSMEFHVTVEQLDKTETGNIISTVCSTFYQITPTSYKQIKPENNYRPSCTHSAIFGKISNEHAESFKQFIKLYLKAKSATRA
jgi:hypothetical protein